MVWNFAYRLNLIEDKLLWKISLNERKPWMDVSLWWKMAFNGERPLMEDDPLWRMKPLNRRVPSIEDNLCWKTTLDLTAITRTLTWIYHFAIKQRSENQATKCEFDNDEPILVNNMLVELINMFFRCIFILSMIYLLLMCG